MWTPQWDCGLAESVAGAPTSLVVNLPGLGDDLRRAIASGLWEGRPIHGLSLAQETLALRRDGAWNSPELLWQFFREGLSAGRLQDAAAIAGGRSNLILAFMTGLGAGGASACVQEITVGLKRPPIWTIDVCRMVEAAIICGNIRTLRAVLLRSEDFPTATRHNIRAHAAATAMLAGRQRLWMDMLAHTSNVSEVLSSALGRLDGAHPGAYNLWAGAARRFTQAARDAWLERARVSAGRDDDMISALLDSWKPDLAVFENCDVAWLRHHPAVQEILHRYRERCALAAGTASHEPLDLQLP